MAIAMLAGKFNNLGTIIVLKLSNLPPLLINGKNVEVLTYNEVILFFMYLDELRLFHY